MESYLFWLKDPRKSRKPNFLKSLQKMKFYKFTWGTAYLSFTNFEIGNRRNSSKKQTLEIAQWFGIPILTLWPTIAVSFAAYASSYFAAYASSSLPYICKWKMTFFARGPILDAPEIFSSGLCRVVKSFHCLCRWYRRSEICPYFKQKEKKMSKVQMMCIHYIRSTEPFSVKLHK